METQAREGWPSWSGPCFVGSSVRETDEAVAILHCCLPEGVDDEVHADMIQYVIEQLEAHETE